MTTQAKKYRFNDATGEVYELNAAGDAYVFLCTYMSAGISPSMREATKSKKMSAYGDRV